jgi:plasmid stability protein
VLLLGAFSIVMAVLMIKDLPEALHRRLKERAAANRRSISEEAITILQSALHDRLRPPTLDEIDRIAGSGKSGRENSGKSGRLEADEIESSVDGKRGGGGRS